MKVSISTVFDEIYTAEAHEVVLPGDEGELSVMDFHQPIVCRLTKGFIRIISRRKEKLIPVIDGIAHMEGAELDIMVEVQ